MQHLQKNLKDILKKKKKFENDLSIIQIIIRWLTLNQVNCFSDWLDYLYNSSAFYRLVNGFGERLWLLAAHGLNELMIELGQFCQYITCPAMLEFMLCSQQGQCVIETTSGRRRCYWVNHQSVIVEEFFIGFFLCLSLSLFGWKRLGFSVTWGQPSFVGITWVFSLGNASPYIIQCAYVFCLIFSVFFFFF